MYTLPWEVLFLWAAQVYVDEMCLFQNQPPKNVTFFFGGGSKKSYIRLHPIVTDHQDVFFLRTYVEINDLRSQKLLESNLVSAEKVPGPTF